MVGKPELPWTPAEAIVRAGNLQYQIWQLKDARDPKDIAKKKQLQSEFKAYSNYATAMDTSLAQHSIHEWGWTFKVGVAIGPPGLGPTFDPIGFDHTPRDSGRTRQAFVTAEASEVLLGQKGVLGTHDRGIATSVKAGASIEKGDPILGDLVKTPTFFVSLAATDKGKIGGTVQPIIPVLLPLWLCLRADIQFYVEAPQLAAASATLGDGIDKFNGRLGRVGHKVKNLVLGAADEVVSGAGQSR
jgi:hypothetical protein